MLTKDVKELRNDVRRLQERHGGPGTEGSTAQLEAERDYLLQSLEEFEAKIILLESHVADILGAVGEANQGKLFAEQALAEANHDKLQAIEMAEMLVRQRLCETEVALNVVNHRQGNPMGETLVPTSTLLAPPGRPPPPPFAREGSPVPVHSPPY